MYFSKISQWILTIFVGLWVFGCSQKSETLKSILVTLCSDLSKKTDNQSICVASEKDSKAVNKIDLKGKITEQNVNTITSTRFQTSELITELDLSDNPHLTSLPKFILDFPDLTRLDISNTNISDWDEEFCQLKKLEIFIGRNNSYKDSEIPFHTFCLKNLKVLDMSHSHIRYIDEYIGKNFLLEELHMAHNQMVIIPLMLSTLPNLTLVNFRENNLKNEDLNIIQSCKSVPEDEREDCQEDLVDSIECEFVHELPFQRKEPLRQMYTDLAGNNEKLLEQCSSGDDKFCPHFVKTCKDILDEEDRSKCRLDEFEKTDTLGENQLHRDRCYINWIGWTVDYNKFPYLLEKTIRGKTIRELKYTSRYQSATSCWSLWLPLENIRTLGGLIDFSPTRHDVKPFEVFPEQFREPGIASHVKSWTETEGFLNADEQWWIPSSDDEGRMECPHLPNLKESIERMQREQQ